MEARVGRFSTIGSRAMQGARRWPGAFLSGLLTWLTWRNVPIILTSQPPAPASIPGRWHRPTAPPTYPASNRTSLPERSSPPDAASPPERLLLAAGRCLAVSTNTVRNGVGLLTRATVIFLLRGDTPRLGAVGRATSPWAAGEAASSMGPVRESG
jgi:hypothetical protein